jgi:hypothetical protein
MWNWSPLCEHGTQGRRPLCRACPRSVREKQLLSADLEVSDGPLAFGRDEPIHESLSVCGLDVRVLLRVNRDL